MRFVNNAKRQTATAEDSYTLSLCFVCTFHFDINVYLLLIKPFSLVLDVNLHTAWRKIGLFDYTTGVENNTARADKVEAIRHRVSWTLWLALATSPIAQVPKQRNFSAR